MKKVKVLYTFKFNRLCPPPRHGPEPYSSVIDVGDASPEISWTAKEISQ